MLCPKCKEEVKKKWKVCPECEFNLEIYRAQEEIKKANAEIRNNGINAQDSVVNVKNTYYAESDIATKRGEPCHCCGELLKSDYFVCKTCGNKSCLNCRSKSSKRMCEVCEEEKQKRDGESLVEEKIIRISGSEHYLINLNKLTEIEFGNSARIEHPVGNKANDINFRFPDISRAHFCLTFSENNMYLVDRGSKWGTYINMHKAVPEKKTELNHKDTLQLGRVITLKVLKVRNGWILENVTFSEKAGYLMVLGDEDKGKLPKRDAVLMFLTKEYDFSLKDDPVKITLGNYGNLNVIKKGIKVDKPGPIIL